jgi:DnaJ-class molecular chaperone
MKTIIREYAVCPNCNGTGKARWHQPSLSCLICHGEGKIVIKEEEIYDN